MVEEVVMLLLDVLLLVVLLLDVVWDPELLPDVEVPLGFFEELDLTLDVFFTDEDVAAAVDVWI